MASDRRGPEPLAAAPIIRWISASLGLALSGVSVKRTFLKERANKVPIAATYRDSFTFRLNACVSDCALPVSSARADLSAPDFRRLRSGIPRT